MKKLHKILSTLALLMLFATTMPTTFAIGATPLRAMLKATPGDTVKGVIHVQNTENTTKEIVLKKGDFRIREDESIQFLLDKDPENKWSMQDWITFDENNVTVDPTEERTVSYTIKVPRDAKSQSYYGVVFISSKTPSNEDKPASTVGVSTNIAHLILLEVGDDLKADVQLKDFTIDTKQYGDAKNEFRFTTLFFNNGNTHTAPVGTITIKDSNQNVIDEIPFNKDKFNDLPERQKTVVNTWDYSDVEPGVYTASLNGSTPGGQNFSGKLTFTIQAKDNDQKSVVVGKADVKNKQQDNSPSSNRIIVYILIFIILLSVFIKLAYIAKKKKFLGLFSIMLILGSITVSGVHAQSTDELDINLTVEAGQISSFNLNGCWGLNDANAWNFEDTDTTANLNQPGDRENMPPSTGGDQYDWYDVHGGTANGNLTPTNTNTFGYDDCQFKVTAENWSAWNITLYSDAFDDGLGHEVPDMAGYSTAGFDYNLESEDPNTGGGTQYPLEDGEHGFFIVHKSASMVSPATDTGSAGGTTYTTQKTFDATTCGDGSARPCYHFIPDSSNPQTIFSSSSNVTDETFVTRFGMGADFSIPAGNYNATVTLTLNTTP